jgi:hypothetical protein
MPYMEAPVPCLAGVREVLDDDALDDAVIVDIPRGSVGYVLTFPELFLL